MKKTMRTMICLLLVVVAVAGLAVPAMAAVSPTTKNCAGTYSGLKYTGKLKVTTSTVTSTMTYAGTAKIKTEVTADLWNELNKAEHTNAAFTTGLSSVNASVNNIFVYGNAKVTGEFQYVSGDYLILEKRVDFIALDE